MSKHVTKDVLRARLLKIIPRELLEELSEVAQPWNKERKTLEAIVAASWDDNTYAEIIEFIAGAK